MRLQFDSKFLRPLLLVGALLPLAGVAAALSASAASAQTLVKFGAAQTSAGSLPIVVADIKGLFAAEGLKYERFDFKGGAPAAQALAAGSIDLCICAADHAVHLNAQGLGGKIMVALADQHSYALIGKSDSKANSIADLKGQKIGITAAGSLTDTTIRYAIKKAGLDPDKDFQLLDVGRAGSQRAAMQGGAIAAGMFTTPDIQITLAEPGAYKIIDDFRKMPYPAQDLVVTDDWLKAHPELAKKVSSAVVKALKMIQEDKQVLRDAVKSMFPELDDKMVNIIADDVSAGYLSKDGVMTRESFKNIMDMMKVSEPDLKDIPYDTIMTTAYLPK